VLVAFTYPIAPSVCSNTASSPPVVQSVTLQAWSLKRVLSHLVKCTDTVMTKLVADAANAVPSFTQPALLTFFCI